MSWNVRKLISQPFQCTSNTTRVLTFFEWFTTYYNCMTWNSRKLISPPFQCTNITNGYLKINDRLRFLRTVRHEMSENSYLHYFSAQVSQIVFVGSLTVLRLITTVWPETSESSYFQHFISQVSQIVFFAYLTDLRILTTVWSEF